MMKKIRKSQADNTPATTIGSKSYMCK